MRLVCLNCDWTGTESDLLDVPWYPEDDLPIEGETHQVCPKCKTAGWEPEDDPVQ